jgi:NhaP-type Na+/H+ or K+/H+ antiporter
MLVGQDVNVGGHLAAIPVAVVTGIVVGLVVGAVLFAVFRRFNPRATKRLLTILAVAILLLDLQKLVEHRVPFSALMAVMAIGVVIFEMNAAVAHEIAAKLAKTWIFAQLLLFVLIGAQVDVRLAASVGLAGAAVIVAGLAGRSAGVLLCLVRSQLTWRERGFVVVAYWPKATVQAAIGALPLGALAAAGLPTGPGQLILAVAVLSILFTAPLGALLIDRVGTRVLEVEPGAPPLGMRNSFR